MTLLYAERAELYDAIYHWTDYPREALRIAELPLVAIDRATAAP